MERFSVKDVQADETVSVRLSESLSLMVDSGEIEFSLEMVSKDKTEFPGDSVLETDSVSDSKIVDSTFEEEASISSPFVKTGILELELVVNRSELKLLIEEEPDKFSLTEIAEDSEASLSVS